VVSPRKIWWIRLRVAASVIVAVLSIGFLVLLIGGIVYAQSVGRP